MSELWLWGHPQRKYMNYIICNAQRTPTAKSWSGSSIGICPLSSLWSDLSKFLYYWIQLLSCSRAYHRRSSAGSNIDLYRNSTLKQTPHTHSIQKDWQEKYKVYSAIYIKSSSFRIAFTLLHFIIIHKIQHAACSGEVQSSVADFSGSRLHDVVCRVFTSFSSFLLRYIILYIDITIYKNPPGSQLETLAKCLWELRPARSQTTATIKVKTQQCKDKDIFSKAAVRRS